jgi:hypothetical protein
MPSPSYWEKKKKARSKVVARQEREAEIEAKLVASLAKGSRNPAQVYATRFGDTAAKSLPKRARKILDCEPYWRVIQTCLTYEEKWLRPIDDWKPRGKAIESILKSLIKHLFIKYPVPEFWYAVWFGGMRGTGSGVSPASFIELAQGKSLYKLIKDGQFAVPFTKKQCHTFLGQRSMRHVPQAVRYTQIMSFEGEKRLAQALSDTPWGETIGAPVEEKFRQGVAQWFCNQGMIDPVQVGPLIDYIGNQREENPEWAITGRTGQSLMRAMKEWHRNLANNRRVAQRARWAELRKPPPDVWDSCGIKGWSYQRKGRDKKGNKMTEFWEINEITSLKELREEGRELRHCVASYAWSVSKGGKAIFSLSCGRERRLTIEVHPPTATVVQARGICNQLGGDIEVDLMRRWANERGVVIADRAVRRRW